MGKSLTSHYVGEYCMKFTVYTPDPYRRQTHSSVGFSGQVPKELADFVSAAAINQDFLQKKELKALSKMTERLKKAYTSGLDKGGS